MKQNLVLDKMRRATLHRQGLTSSAPFGKGKTATFAAIERLRYVQIDSLSVVRRAHHHILWARVPSYQASHLESLMQERSIFEYWFHAAAYLPISDYRFALVRMNAVKRNESKWFKSVTQSDEKMVLERIRQEGPLRARDFESKKSHKGTWWNWKPAKKTLEKLFFAGELMVSGRQGIQKIYDLRERVLPSDIDMREPSIEEHADYLIGVCIGAHGFTTRKQVMHQRPEAGLKTAVEAAFKEKLAHGTLEQYSLQGQAPIYMQAGLLDQRMSGADSTLRLLSPFDNVLIHRDRALWLFDYDYKLECYTPAPKRQFGYFCLPILYKGELVGRADCKANIAESRLDVMCLHIEKDMKSLEDFAASFQNAICRFAKFNACDNVSVLNIKPKGCAKVLKPLL